MQCFVVQSDEIARRLDPSPYHPVRVNAIKKIKSTRIKLLPLKEVVTFKKEITTSNSSGLPYIGLQNIESNTGLLIPSKETKDSFGSACTFEKGDILFPKLRPYLNKVYLAEFDGVCSTEFYVLNSTGCNSRYLFSFLISDLVVNQTSYLMTGNALPRLQTDEIKELLMPLPSVEIQNAIANRLQSAYSQKKQKEAEAQRLLDSIDSYVLDELGIKLLEVEGKMCFIVNSEEVQENRVDAYYYQPRFEEVEKAIRKGKYEAVIFESLITDLKNGVEIRTYSDEGRRYLRVTDLGKFGIIDNDPRFVSVEKVPDKIKLKDNSFLISRSGSLGLVSVVEEKIENSILSSHIFKADLNTDKILPIYLEAFFRSALGQIQFFRNNNGGIVPEISQSALKSLSVVLPPLEIQDKIADEVKRRIADAERLKAEASRIIEEAKKQVEGMILGD